MLWWSKKPDTVPKEDIKTKLLLASYKGDAEMVKKLLSEYPDLDINYVNNYGFSALIWAAIGGHHEMAEALLADPRINVNARREVPTLDKSALMQAAEHGGEAIVQALLDFHPQNGQEPLDVNARNKNGHSALLLAAFKKHAAIVKALLHDKRIEVSNSDKELIKANMPNDDEIIGLIQRGGSRGRRIKKSRKYKRTKKSRKTRRKPTKGKPF